MFTGSTRRALTASSNAPSTLGGGRRPSFLLQSALSTSSHFVDKLSKLAHFLSPHHCRHSCRRCSPVFFLKTFFFFKLHGLSQRLSSQTATTDSQQVLAGVAQATECEAGVVRTYHPRTDGQTEVMNRTLKTMLQAFIDNTKLGSVSSVAGGRLQQRHQCFHWILTILHLPRQWPEPSSSCGATQ